MVLRAMKKAPEQRYASWTEFALEISRVGQVYMPAGSIPDSEKYVALKKVPMLGTLADSELWELARAGKWSRVPKGRAIVTEGAKGTSFFFLAQARPKVTKHSAPEHGLGGRVLRRDGLYRRRGSATTPSSRTRPLLAESAAALDI